MDKNYLQAVERKLKKQGKTEKQVEAYIKNLMNPKKKMEEEKIEEVVEEVEAKEEVTPEETEA